MLKDISCSPQKEPAWTVTNAAIDESLFDTFFDENLNIKQFKKEMETWQQLYSILWW